jgi:hypothetical protein
VKRQVVRDHLGHVLRKDEVFAGEPGDGHAVEHAAEGIHAIEAARAGKFCADDDDDSGKEDGDRQEVRPEHFTRNSEDRGEGERGEKLQQPVHEVGCQHHQGRLHIFSALRLGRFPLRGRKAPSSRMSPMEWSHTMTT